MDKKYFDEILIETRNQINEYQENLLLYEKTMENSIFHGFITIEDREYKIEERMIKDRFYMLLPKEFMELPDSLRVEKYPTFYLNDYIIYSNEEATVNLIFDFKEIEMDQLEIETKKKEACELILKLRSDISFVKEERMECGTSLLSYFEFVSPSIDVPIYNISFYFGVKGKLVMGFFNCLETEFPDWEKVIKEMLSTIHLKY